jgi:replicative DNA helicase
LPTPDHKLRIFLCHASQDKPVVRELCQRLGKESWIDPWLDENKLHPGEDWRTTIEKAVESADLVVICLSKNSVNKEGFIQKELRYAREISLEKPEGAIFLIPLRFDDCEVPRGLRFLQWANYFGEDKEQNYEALLESFSFRYKQVIRREESPNLTISSEQRLKENLIPIASVLSDYFDRIDELARSDKDIFGVPTGFIDLDRMLAGLQPGTLSVVSSSPNQGKTSFLLSVAKNATRLFKKHIGIFSLGMTNEQVVHRFIVQETGIDSQRLRLGRLKEAEWPLFVHAMEVMADAHIYIHKNPTITFQDLKTECQFLAKEFLLDLIIVDNSHLIDNNENTFGRTKDFAFNNLKILSQDLNIPILISVQLTVPPNRLDRRPVLSDLQEFGSLKEIADVIMFIHNPEIHETEANNITEIIVAKQTNGPTGTIDIIFRRNQAKFVDAVQRNDPLIEGTDLGDENSLVESENPSIVNDEVSIADEETATNQEDHPKTI